MVKKANYYERRLRRFADIKYAERRLRLPRQLGDKPRAERRRVAAGEGRCETGAHDLLSAGRALTSFATTGAM